jgi:DNA-binding beta-propeller fold protein YncE
VFSRDGARVFLGAWESTTLSVSDAARHEIVKTVGPFSASLCPFTVNAKGTLVFANIDGLVGFEVGDLQTGLILDSVAVEEFDKAAAAAYECPSHGIAFSPDERELWVADGVRNRLHVFDAATYPPTERAAIDLSAQPRWIAFSNDGRYLYASTGDIVSVSSRKIAGELKDAAGLKVTSENFVEIAQP